MAHLILLRNPLTPHEKETYELSPGETPIEWLQEHYPTGFGMPIRYYINADEKPLDDLDRMPDVDDIIIIALMPGGFLAAMPILVKVVIGLAVMAAAYFAMQLFAPKVPKQGKQKDEKETFSVSSDQNAAKYGDPIPVVYGDVWMSPDYVTQPHTWYDYAETAFNEMMSGVQYLDLIMCVGQGHVHVTNVKVGTTDASMLGPQVVSWRAFSPVEHNSQMGVIQAGMGQKFYENVITCPDVDNQEFIKPYEPTPFYTISKAGAKGSLIEIDIIYPNGLYLIDKSSGDMSGHYCFFYTVHVEVDENGNEIGPRITTKHGTATGGNATLAKIKNPAEVSNPVRRTYYIYPGKSGRWAVSMYRESPFMNPSKGMSTFIWSGLKLIADYAPRAYGNVTLLAVRVKASRGVGAEAAVRVTARCRRVNKVLPGVWDYSTSPADAFYDIYTNTDYGAGRPEAELDMVQLSYLKQQWSGYQFNHVFREPSTVWEALKTATVGQAAEPLPLGSVMSIAQDGVKPNRAMLFTDANIVEGTMKVNYLFDIEDKSDGIEVQYISPTDWRESFVRYPATAVVPEAVTLAGCTSTTHASQYARLVWQRLRGQRKRITFDTELEGIILQLGDRIAVSHEMPKWGDNGLILDVNGTTITVDHDLDWSGGAKFMMFRRDNGTPSELYTVTQGAQPNIVILGTGLTFQAHVDDDFDFTAFVFGSATKMVRDFTVSSAKHSGDTTVSIEAMNYAPEIFDGAMTFLGGNP